MIDVECISGSPEAPHFRLDSGGLFLASFRKGIAGALHIEAPEGRFNGASFNSFPK
jgi:hypothetical protein